MSDLPRDRGLTYLLDVLADRLVMHVEAERRVTIDAYDLLGRYLGTIPEESLTPGVHIRPVPPGTAVISIR